MTHGVEIKEESKTDEYVEKEKEESHSETSEEFGPRLEKYEEEKLGWAKDAVISWEVGGRWMALHLRNAQEQSNPRVYWELKRLLRMDGTARRGKIRPLGGIREVYA